MQPKAEPEPNTNGDVPAAANSEDGAVPDNVADEDYKPTDSQGTSEATTEEQQGAVTRKSSRACLLRCLMHRRLRAQHAGNLDVNGRKRVRGPTPDNHQPKRPAMDTQQVCEQRG